MPTPPIEIENIDSDRATLTQAGDGAVSAMQGLLRQLGLVRRRGLIRKLGLMRRSCLLRHPSRRRHHAIVNGDEIDIQCSLDRPLQPAKSLPPTAPPMDDELGRARVLLAAQRPRS